MFQVLDFKERNFLDLFDNDNSPTKPTYMKGGSWLKYFGHSNSLCARATRAITNHAPIGEYHLRFFPKESFTPQGQYPIETRNHIIYKCRRFNNYWNPNRESLKNFIAFLEFNPGLQNFIPFTLT